MIAFCSALLGFSLLQAQTGGELRFCLRSEPKTFNPALVDDEASETIRYLTGGVLLRVNRLTQKPQPALATEWKVSKDGKQISFKLREGVRYSDGTPFSADDVAYTMDQLMDPALHSSTGDAFRSGEGKVVTRVISPTAVEIVFPAAVANLVNLFDTVAIVSSKSPLKEMAALGPFYVAEHKSGSYILLKHNPNYWRKDSSGHQLPYIDAVRLYIEQNRDMEALRFQRGEIQLINTVNPAIYNQLANENAAQVRDAGTSTDSEQLWFNQTPTAPIPAYKLAWFTSTAFRRAVSEAIDRDALARIVFHGHARAAIGFLAPANLLWFNSSLKPHPYDAVGALRSLEQEGFQMDKEKGILRDKSGNAVEFSIITNAGNSYRLSMATMIQEDLKKIGMKVNVVALDFNSLLERITKNYNYEACLLGNVNAGLDPSDVRTAWESSGEEHAWYPKQKSPATKWEAEIDDLLRAEAKATDQHTRKQYWDKIQKIAWEQEPFIYLVNKDALVAISPSLKNAQPSALRPQTYWNIDELELAKEAISKQ
jgi:peptide/nickel transport system substrate-binding protein